MITIDQFFNDLNERILDGEGIRDIVYELENYGIVDMIKNILKKDMSDITILDKDIMHKTLQICQNIYNYADGDVQSPIEDSLYDDLYNLYKKITGIDIFAENVRGKKIAHHAYVDLRGTLDKVHFITKKEKGDDNKLSLEEWLDSAEIICDKSLKKETVMLAPKWDGVSVVFECDPQGNVINALGRGDVESNEAVSLIEYFKDVDFSEYAELSNGDYFGVKTEVLMTVADYHDLCKKEPFKSPRSAVSSILNSKEVNEDYLCYLSIHPISLQVMNSRETIDVLIDKRYSDMYIQTSFTNKYIRECIQDIRDRADELGLPIDGVVMTICDENIKKALGRNNHINQYQCAFKFPAETKETTLLDVEFNMGLLGIISPVAKVEPVILKGNSISSISLGSMDRFESLNLHRGEKVLIKYDIIPYLNKIDRRDAIPNGAEKIETPYSCKFCGIKLLQFPVLRCLNLACSGVAIGKIVNYLEKMRIPNINYGIIKTLYSHDIVTNIRDLYDLKNKRAEVEYISGFGKKSYDKLIESIEYRNTAYDYELLGSLGISGVGRKMFKRILDIYYLDEFIDACMNNDAYKLKDIRGIDSKTANRIITGIQTNYKLIMFLRKKLDIRRGNTYSKTVLFTKIRDKEFEKYLESISIQVADGYSKEVDYLIVKDKDTRTTKVTKAEKDGVEIITYDEAIKLFGYDR